MPSTVTFTGDLGPGFEATALVLEDVVSFTVNVDQSHQNPSKQVLQVERTRGRFTHLAIDDTTTVTATVANGAWTVTLTNV
jgi:hypothetical protein